MTNSISTYNAGGCNGLSYTMNYAEKKAPMEEEVSEKGVRVFVEPKALFHVVGTTMDFQVSYIFVKYILFEYQQLVNS
jgi:Fe-S cluster assembly iron-binding protein IscA